MVRVEFSIAMNLHGPGIERKESTQPYARDWESVSRLP